MNKCWKENSNNKYKELYYLYNEEIGSLCCWRNREKTCYSDCIAWEENGKIVRCKALPSSDQIVATIIDKPVKTQNTETPN